MARNATSSKGGGKKKTMILGWISYSLAACGGGALMASPVGTAVAWLTGATRWFGVAVLVIAVGGMTVDILIDLVPNKLAVAVAILAPSMAMGAKTTGKHRGKHSQFVETMRTISGSIADVSRDRIGPFLGTASMLAVALILIVLAWLIARRTMKGAAA